MVFGLSHDMVTYQTQENAKQDLQPWCVWVGEGDGRNAWVWKG